MNHRKKTKHRKKMVAGVAIAGTMMTGVSGAAACTSWLGKFQVTGDAAAGGGTVTANGMGTWDSVNNRAATWEMAQHVDSTIAKASRNNGTVKISTGPADSGIAGVTAGTKLPEFGSGETAPTSGAKRNYRVKFYNSTDPVLGAGYSDHENWSTDCMSAITDRGNDGYNIINNTGQVASPVAGVLGNVTVDGNGEIDNVVSGGTFDAPTKTAMFNLPGSLRPDTAPTESAVCVSDNAAYYGNQAPLTIV